MKEILQGVGFGPGSVTERWPCKNNAQKSAFFITKIRNTLIFKKDIPYIYAKILGGKNFHTRKILRSGSKAKDGEKEKKERKRD